MSVRRNPRRLAALIALALLFALGAVAGPARAAGPILPSQDPFYTYTGTTKLAKIAPGTVLKTRTVQVSLVGVSTPVTADQLLYRTQDEKGRPSVTVTTVLKPATATVAPQIVTYLSFYDSLGSQCDPSYTLAGGNPGSSGTELTDIESALIGQYYSLGYVVDVPDFEGTNLDWTAGHEAGYGTLDSVRATEADLGAPASTPVGLSGYSGGSIAADWASELAPKYAPSLDIVGVAAGGVPVDFDHNLDYINGSPAWSGIIPAVLVALSRSYRIDLTPYLSDYGVQLTHQVQDECIGDFYGAYPNLTIQQLLKPQYQDFTAIPIFATVMNRLIMGSVPGHPVGPLFLAVGNDDSTGDGVMVTADVEALAHEYCKQGVPVSFTTYSNSDHDDAALEFEPDATTFLAQRFAGVPFTSGCSSIGKGNSLKPLPVHKG